MKTHDPLGSATFGLIAFVLLGFIVPTFSDRPIQHRKFMIGRTYGSMNRLCADISAFQSDCRAPHDAFELADLVVSNWHCAHTPYTDIAALYDAWNRPIAMISDGASIKLVSRGEDGLPQTLDDHSKRCPRAQ